jgi:hypothetical protein
MRKSVVLMGGLVVATCVASASAMAADFSSWWKIQAQYRDGNGAQPICFFQQAGFLLSGTCKGPNGIGPVQGQVNGDQIMFTAHMQAYTPRGASGNYQYSGAMGPDGNMSGTSINAMGAPGTFTGMRH